MAKPVIPEREPLGDVVSGTAVSDARTGTHALLIPEAVPENSTILASGALTVRYGIRYLGKPHLSIVPGLVAVDYGTFLTGEAAWDFLLNRSNLYPRAEIFGYRNDGLDEMQYVKLLDIVLPIDVLVYASPQATRPAARPAAIIAPDEVELPRRVTDTLPRFSTWAKWQASL
ncbi:MAG: hypothetical protein U0670_06360 [Anaerolineae bacterium]